MTWGGMNAGMWLLMLAGTGAFWAVVFWTVRTLVIRQEASSARAADPMWGLKERLTQGEITVDEYWRIRNLVDNLPGQVILHPRST
jgi:uncharacterized membrane protein